MCGIAGYIRLDQSIADREPIERMVAALKHRGPDAQTVHLDGPVSFGHARLSIIDLAGGHQPLFNEDHSVAVICNGEIYNYRELRERLIQCGHQFRTDSDCEVIAHLWEEHGRKAVDHLRGMFALVLYDRRQDLVFGARDRFGQKPIFYVEGSTSFAFASEIKSLLTLPDINRELDPIALDQFLFHQFVPQPRTLFAGIKRLRAGCWFELRLPRSKSVDSANAEIVGDGNRLPSNFSTSSFKIHRYWQPEFKPDMTLSDSEHLNRIEVALADAVRSHMVADVPVGVFLSGGIDSSLITAFASKFNPGQLQTFSISFPGSEHDESSFARAVSKEIGTIHREFPFDPGDMRQVLTHSAVLFDQPLADVATLPLMALSRAASEFVKVVLTGDGGDELFGGYRKYKRLVGIPGRYRWLSDLTTTLFPIHQLSACRPDPFLLHKLQARIAMVMAPTCRGEYNRQSWEGWERFVLYQPELVSSVENQIETVFESDDSTIDISDTLNTVLARDQGTVLADRLLLKGDYATMAFGLESRAPLLDHELAAVAGRLPIHLKATTQETKVALRSIARRYLPSDIIHRRKKGFSMPIDRWFRNELKPWIKNSLLDESVTLPRFFQRSTIERLLSEHDRGKNHSTRILSLLMFELWCREYAS